MEVQLNCKIIVLEVLIKGVHIEKRIGEKQHENERHYHSRT